MFSVAARSLRLRYVFFAGVDMSLTERESAILAHIAQGLNDREIALVLAITPATARKHRENIQSKLDAGKAALLVWHFFHLHSHELKKRTHIRPPLHSRHVNRKFWNCWHAGTVTNRLPDTSA
jgi:DNA-binding CsgD family transcriptional regulator